LAFNIRDKKSRVPEDDPGHRYKVKHKKIPFSDVKKMVEEIREKREKEKNDKLREENDKYFRRMKYI